MTKTEQPRLSLHHIFIFDNVENLGNIVTVVKQCSESYGLCEMSNNRGPFIGEGQILVLGNDLSNNDNKVPVVIYAGMDENTELNQISVCTPEDWLGSREYRWCLQLPDAASIEVIARCIESMSPVTKEQLESIGFVDWADSEGST